MAPECEEITCTGSGLHFRSLIPPISNHLSSDPADFDYRISSLSREDLESLLGLIRDRSESLGCIPFAHISILIDHIGREIGLGGAAEVLEIYEISRRCDE